MVVDRLGKIRNTRISLWDCAYLGFAVGYGAALIYADLYMSRDMGFLNYISWMNAGFNGYMYFLVLREGLMRRGFRVEIVLRWMVATLFVMCLLAITQARDFMGLRAAINHFYHQAELEMHMEGPSQPWQARAPADHANSLAVMLLAGLPVFFALYDLKKSHWFDWVVCALVVVTLFMTYSRTGILGLGAEAIALIGILFARKQYKKAAIAGLALVAGVLAFAVLVATYDIARFRVLTQDSPTALPAAGGKTTAGWRARTLSIDKSLTIAEQFPVFGLRAASGSLNVEDIIYDNAYSYPGLLLNVYVYSFVSYGLMGVGFIALLFAMMLSQGRFLRKDRAFAAAAVMLCIGMMAAGVAENVLFFDGSMITVNILVAGAVAGVKPAESIETRYPHQKEAA